ncbi:vacuolar protein sorting-associated protein VTA1 homolog [Tribolium castaneum]|uniref:Vacuolar protein sorting-associated protein VTA1 homolog-like Protein n=1 Tax=Tribolium castaneum TaxID=7070 RepID=D6WNP1_TRICA|nr:PREDICTED: vacuolar protein sorting-associated protein VTA1 homolog [Tribolium castaneum]EFA03831.1 Vacuolar protein sorting-associated protein VTA1 homolog-like Protein [Tribolium castaneum]|eukprot:XP_970311.1 PREDICTED: vacuolar protein sorting-associated protein VTA1 homolog [Tribolium castaneum]
MGFPPVPPVIKSIAHVLKVADEHESRDIVVSYWARMYACQSAMKLIPGKKPPEVSNLLIALMDWLETTKKSHHDLEGITNETVAQAMIENYAMQLFTFADAQDRAENFNKNMIKAFYTAGILMDILEQFGEQSEEIINKKKYAKWKAAYIHNCLKSGDKPTSGGPDDHLKNVIDVSKGEDDASQNTLLISPRPYRDFPTHVGYNPPTGPAPASSPVTPVVPPEPQEFTPQPEPPTPPVATTNNDGGFAPGPEQIQKAQKYCKYATSALNYDDVKTAIENLTKALSLLQAGKE